MQPTEERQHQSVRLLASDGSCSATLNYTHHSGTRLMPQKMVIRDGRRIQQEGGISLEASGFQLVRHHTALASSDFYTFSDFKQKGHLEALYEKETEQLLAS